MIGAGGTPTLTPEEFEDFVHDSLPGEEKALRALYEQARAYGRWEADNAISWMTSCLNCAKRLDGDAEGFFQGERAGLTLALHALQQAQSLEDARAVVAGQLAEYQSMPAWTPEAAERRVQAFRTALVRAGILPQPHGYTHHGHPCCPQAPSQTPRLVARCGGPGMCGQCSAEAGTLHAA